MKEAYGIQAKNMLRIPRTSIDGVKTILEGMDQKLVSITFEGSYENVVVSHAGMQAGGK